MRETRTALPAEFEELKPLGMAAPLIISLTGQPGSGKTRLGATAPGDIGLIPTHRKAYPTAASVADKFGRRVIVPKDNFARSSNPLAAKAKAVCDAEDDAKKSDKAFQVDIDQPQPKCCTKHSSRWMVDRMKRAAMQMVAMPSVKTLLIDSGTHLYEDVVFACYGRDEKIIPLDRKIANREMRDFLEALAVKNLIVTHEAQEIWEDYGPPIDAKGNRKSRPTGKFKPSGWKHIGYFASIELEMVVDADVPAGEGRYRLDVKKCQENAALVGRAGLLTDDAITFQNVAAAIWPDADPDVWD